MNKIKELKIDSTLWATPSKIINLLDFKPEKLSIETKNNSNNNIKVHHVRYENGGFYLTIDNIRGHFNFSNNNRILTMIFANDEQQNKYHQVWKEILKIINRGHGELKLHEKIRLFDVDLPIKHVFKIPSISIVIRSLIEKNNKFYLELSLNHCLYETKAWISVCETYKKMISIKIKDPLFTYYARSVNILGFNLEKLSIEKVIAINDKLERIYYVKYNNNPFYLVINNLKSYFKYSKEKIEKN